jgi:hypothetical protein
MRYDPYGSLVGLVATALLCGTWAVLVLVMSNLNPQVHPWAIALMVIAVTTIVVCMWRLVRRREP